MDASVVFPFALFAAAGTIFALPLLRTGQSAAIDKAAEDYENAALGMYASLGTDDWDGEAIYRARLTKLQLDFARKALSDSAFEAGLQAAIRRRGRLTVEHLRTLEPLLPRQLALVPAAVQQPATAAVQPAA